MTTDGRCYGTREWQVPFPKKCNETRRNETERESRQDQEINPRVSDHSTPVDNRQSECVEGKEMNRMGLIEVSQGTLISAVRYAIGRSTYIVSDTCAVVRGTWDALSPKTQEVIIRDVERALNDTMTFLGHQQDADEWRDLLAYMTERRTS